MDRERFEDLIIDYLDNTLSVEDKTEFEKALESYEQYRELVDQYRSIRMVSGTDEETVPPKELIDKISSEVKQSVKKEKVSYFNRLIKFPVLAPALAAAVIAMLWFSAGEDYLKNKNIIPVSENASMDEFRSDYKASAGKLTQNREVFEESAKPSETDSIDSEIKNIPTPEVLGKSPAAPAIGMKELPKEESSSSIGLAKDKVKMDTKGNFAQSAADLRADIPDRDNKSKEEVYGVINERTAKTPYDEKVTSEVLIQREQNTNGLEYNAQEAEEQIDDITLSDRMKRSSKGIASAKKPLKPGERVEIMNSYRKELNEIVTMQYTGDCQGTIDRSQKLLDSEPEPSPSIKTDLYLTQGECYTELKQYEKALEIYNKAKEQTPHKSYLFNAKIKEVYMKQTK